MEKMEYRIHKDRLMKNLFEMAKIGMNDQGGIDRSFGSEADYQTREWLKHYWECNLGLSATTDAIANLRIQREGTEKLLPIVIGSHHDAVPNGGKYDGALGVLAATEIMQRIIEQNITLRHPLQVISFSGEEPNPFQLSTIGSKVICGRLTKENLTHCKHRETGGSISSVVKRFGGDIECLETARLQKGTVAAFLEVHNEMGSHLEKENLSVATVSHITGIYREEYTIIGETNHAGTTTMEERHDAFLALCELSLKIEQAAKAFHDPHVVATIGYGKIFPNEASIISGQVTAIADIRTYDSEIVAKILSEIGVGIAEIEKRRGVKIERKKLLDQPCQTMDEQVIKAIESGIQSIGEPEKQLISMAGHDTVNMGYITKAGMIFVKSIGGKGHCKEEYSKEEDIVKMANVLFHAILKLDEELDAV